MINGFESLEQMYDEYWGSGKYLSPNHSFLEHKPVEWLLESGLEFDSVLEAGCGNGGSCKKLWEAKKKVCGIEFSGWLYNNVLVQKNIPDQGEGRYLSFSNGDIADMPEFKDGQFDMICSFDVLEHLPEDRAIMAIKEMYRVSNRYWYGTICPRADHFGKFHLTVKPLEWWEEQFVAAGWKPIEVEQRHKFKIQAFEK